MLNILSIKISGERVIINSDEGLHLIDSPCLIALNESNEIALDANNKPVSIGESLEIIEERLRLGREQLKPPIHLRNPFLLDDFHPRLAAVVISHLAYLAIDPTLKYRYGNTYTSAEWQLTIEGYEKLDKEIQDLFEFYLQSSSWVDVNKILINGQVKAIRKYKIAEQAIKLGLILTFGVISLLTYSAANLFFGEEMIKPITGLSCAVLGLSFVFLLYLSAVIYIAMCRNVFRCFILAPVYTAMIEYVDLSPKHLLNLLFHKRSSSANISG